MKRRGWWIAGGILFLYLSPVIYGLIQNLGFSLFGTTDYTDYWERRGQGSGLSSVKKAEAERKPEYASIMIDPKERQRAEILFKYMRTPDPVPMPKIKVVIVGDLDDGWEPSPYLHVDNTPLFPPQPDLSGMYYQRQIVGPNAGQWSINYIDGPN